MKKNAFEYVWTDKKRSLFGLPLTFTRYYLTETKFITRTGFLNIDEDEIDLYKITDKKVSILFFSVCSIAERSLSTVVMQIRLQKKCIASRM